MKNVLPQLLCHYLYPEMIKSEGTLTTDQHPIRSSTSTQSFSQAGKAGMGRHEMQLSCARDRSAKDAAGAAEEEVS